MTRESERAPGLTRRRFVATTAVAGVASTLAPRILRAHTPKYHRWNISHPHLPPRVLESYKKAITKMLQLPPSDPRNWYRHTLVHTIDCPHGNWWFLVWHRGYVGWFERICRELSGDPHFALPFWDWTIEPKIPDAMYDGVLDPRDPSYIASFADFQSQFSQPLQDWYAGFSAEQNAQLTPHRQWASTAQSLLANIEGTTQFPPMFFPSAEARRLPMGQMFDAGTSKAVSEPTVVDALDAKSFVPFGSFVTPQHSIGMRRQGVLESQPHNNVHGAVGGFMGDFMSPTDPVFFLHHANIDRLWDVWTRKQQVRGLPTLPEGQELTDWQNEPFLFFVDGQGNPVSETKAGDYTTIGDFDYDYERGTGEDEVWEAPSPPSGFAGRTFAGEMRVERMSVGASGMARVAAPAELVAEASRERGTTVVAEVTLDHPADPTTRFQVFVNVPADAASLDLESPHHAGTIAFFGAAREDHGPTTFQVPISDALRRLREVGKLAEGEPIEIHVVPETRGVALRAMAPARLGAVSLTVF